jgi:hypothetical protein
MAHGPLLEWRQGYTPRLALHNSIHASEQPARLAAALPRVYDDSRRGPPAWRASAIEIKVECRERDTKETGPMTIHMRVALLAIALMFAVVDSPIGVQQAAARSWGGPINRWHYPMNDEPNRVPNPGFAVDAGTGKVADWVISHPASTSVSNEHPTGGKSILMKDVHLTQFSDSVSTDFDLPAGRYSLRVWMKAVGVKAVSGPGVRGGRVDLMGAEAVRKEWVAATALITGDKDWTSFSRLMFKWRGGKVRLSFTPIGSPMGELYFAEPELKQVQDAPADMYLLYPNFMGQLWNDGPQEIRASVAGAPGDLALVNGGGTVVATRTIAVDGDVSLTVPPGSPDGIYTLTWRTAAAATFLPRARIVKGPRSPIRVDPDGVWVQPNTAGVPTRRFPLLAFHTSGFTSTKAAWIGLMSGKAGSGVGPFFPFAGVTTPSLNFDQYLNYWLGRANPTSLSLLGSALSKAGRGMSYFHTVNNFWAVERNPDGTLIPDAAKLTTIAQALSGKPGIAGFYVADERPPEMANSTWAMKEILREHAPDLVTRMVHFVWNEHDFPVWADIAEVHAIDPYPIRVNNVNADGTYKLEEVAQGVLAARRGLKDARPVIATLQFFAGRHPWRWPSVKELRQMSFMAIAAGAKGLDYWSLGNLGLRDQPITPVNLYKQRFDELRVVTDEVLSHEPALIGQDVPLPVALPAGVIGSARRVGAKIHLFTSNLTNVTVTGLGKTWGPYDPLMWSIDAPPPLTSSATTVVTGRGDNGNTYVTTLRAGK